jgi:hypothetical protein
MRKLPIDGSKIVFIATGKFAPVPEYAQLADGSSRRIPESHATNDQGVPLYVVDVMPDDDEADRAEVIGVKVASRTTPELAKFQPVQFIDLVASVYVPRGTSRAAVSFTASGVAAPVKG